LRRNKETKIEEFHIYSSSRLGTLKTQYDTITNQLQNDQGKLILGSRNYELTNHLGNVLAVISDKKILNGTTFEVDIVSANDYYPFGMTIASRTFQSEEYRFGFQGQETEKELFDGNGSFFKYRISDNRIGRFFAADPLFAEFPWNSCYAFSENKIIQFIELEGAEVHPSDAQTLARTRRSRTALFPIGTAEFFDVTDGQVTTTISLGPNENTYKEAALGSGLPIRVGDISYQLDGRDVPEGWQEWVFESPGRANTVVTEFSNFIAQNAGTNMPDERDEGYGKVFRHLVWQGLLSRRVGGFAAKSIGDAFERNHGGRERNGTPILDGTQNWDGMSWGDLINNHYGRQFYTDFRKSKTIKNTDVTTEQGLLNFLNYVSEKVTDFYNQRENKNIQPHKFTTNSTGFKELLDAMD